MSSPNPGPDPNPNPDKDLSAIVGKHLIYTYANGWRYEMYVKNAETIDYRIHSGMVGGRWVKNQTVQLAQVSTDLFKVSWTEPTGTSVSVDLLPTHRRLHGVIFFPQWVHQFPERTICFQNEYLERMAEYREAGPTYPIFVVSEPAAITFLEDSGPDDEEVITVGPAGLPEGYATRTN